MGSFLETMKEFLKVSFIVVLWLIILSSFIGGAGELNHGGGGLAGGALVAGTLLFLFHGSKKSVSPNK